jgi:hypothetical protein
VLSPGDTVGGRYRVVERIASGLTGQVYRAHDDALRIPVALKVFPDAGAADRREAAAIARLDHPNVVRVYDVVDFEGGLCLVQEWVAGPSLERLLADDGRLDLSTVTQVATDVALGLEHAHRQGIVHRDVKPSNVLRDGAGRFKLVDFGSVGQLEVSTGLTSAGQLAGTPYFMSPEQLTGAPQGPASDFYALGLVLFRCLYGSLPGDQVGDLLELMRLRLSGPPDVPESPLRPLVVACLAIDPFARPQSAAEVLALLPGGAPAGATSPELDWPATRRPADATGWLYPVEESPEPREAYPEPGSVGLDARRLAGSGLRRWPVAAGAIAVVVVAAVLATASGHWAAVLLVLNGCALAVIGVVVAVWLRRRWALRAAAVHNDAGRRLLGLDSEADLSRSLMLEVDQLFAELRSVDDRLLGMTMKAMLVEYENAGTSPERMAALLGVVDVLEKVRGRLAPWYVRHRDAITTGIAVAGCVTGVISALQPFLS